MLAVLSPSKTLDYASPALTKKCSQPEFLEDSSELIKKLRSFSRPQLAKLMSISPKLTELNHERFATWTPDFTPDNARQALLAFKGDVYHGFNLQDYKAADFTFAQKHLRILSGLYGLLRPLDLMQPYRLEMGTDLKTHRGKDLYAFWDTKVTDALNEALTEQKDDVLINLASNEYFNVIREERLDAQVITPVFKDRTKNGDFRILALFAKKARGTMIDHMIRNRLTKPKELKPFNTGGYKFSAKESTAAKFVFLRDKR